MRRPYVFPFTAVVLLAASTASAAIIDDFSTAQGPVIGSPGLVTDQQTGSMLGGERDAVVQQGGAFTASSGSASWGGADGGFIYDGTDMSATNTYGLGGVDLTDGGMSDRFLLTVVSISGPVNLSVSAFESTGNSLSIFTPGTSAGLVEILFTDLTLVGSGANLAAANMVNLGFFSVSSSDVLVVDNFCTGNANGCVGGDAPAVPEPSTWLLLAGGLALAALKRQRA